MRGGDCRLRAFQHAASLRRLVGPATRAWAIEQNPAGPPTQTGSPTARGASNMTYQGVRARPMATESGRSFEVSKVRIGPDGHVSDVLWGEVDPAADRVMAASAVATAAEVVDAIHDGARVMAVFPSDLPERDFVVVEHRDGRLCIHFDGAPSPGRDVTDIASLDD
jgi:hypothetical protein